MAHNQLYILQSTCAVKRLIPLGDAAPKPLAVSSFGFTDGMIKRQPSTSVYFTNHSKHLVTPQYLLFYSTSLQRKYITIFRKTFQNKYANHIHLFIKINTKQTALITPLYVQRKFSAYNYITPFLIRGCDFWNNFNTYN